MAYVYVITNDLFPGLSKIGSSKSVDSLVQNMTDLIPGRSRIAWSQLVEDADYVATNVRTVLDKFSVPSSCGWYSCPAGVAIEQFRRSMAQIDSLSIMVGSWLEDKKHIRSVADLGAFCHTWRLQIGMSQQDLADHANVDLQFIIDIEDGKTNCRMDWCLGVAALLGIDLFAAKR